MNDKNWLNYDKWLFEPANNNALSDYMCDTIRLLLDDEEFFTISIDVLEPNSFGLEMWRQVAYTIKEFFNFEGVRPTLEEVFSRMLTKARDEIARRELEELYEVLKNRNLTESRKNQIRRSFNYWNMYVLSIKLSNLGRDAAVEGYQSTANFNKVIGEIIKVSDSLKVYYNVVNGGNDW